MEKKQRVVIVEDHAIIRDGLRSLLNKSNGLEVVGEAEDGLKAIRCIKKQAPDLVILDINMPKMDGLSVVYEARAQFPKIKIIILTMFKDEEYIIQTFKLGVDGYCLKSSSFDELKMAIDAVLSGKQFISPEISEKVMDGFMENKRSIKKTSSWESLTQREKEVLKLVGEGYKNKIHCRLSLHQRQNRGKTSGQYHE